MIKVIHKKDADKYEEVIYVGRGSALGNPYTSIKGRDTLAQFVVDSRKESIDSFRKYLLECIEKKEEKVCNLLNQIYALALEGEVCLSCYCKPKSCHGDVIKEVVEMKIKEKSLSSKITGTQLNIFGEDLSD
jgi:hypothetical protein